MKWKMENLTIREIETRDEFVRILSAYERLKSISYGDISEYMGGLYF
jgi:hypothetical protein